MTWLQRYRINRFVRDSVWLPPLLAMVLVMIVQPLVDRLDRILEMKAIVGPEGARAVLAALASSMLTFIVFVFSIMLVTVQLASAQLTPRIIATFFRSGILRLSLTVFVFAFTYTLAALSRIEDSVPQITVWIATYSSAACVGIFLYLIDDVGKSLRPVSVLTNVGKRGRSSSATSSRPVQRGVTVNLGSIVRIASASATGSLPSEAAHKLRLTAAADTRGSRIAPIAGWARFVRAAQSGPWSVPCRRRSEP